MMKMPWNNRFRRRQSSTEAELQADYPTDCESEISDDDRRRRTWQGQVGAAPSGGVGQGQGEQQEWEYVSEYNVSFSSDDSVIDAYREHGGGAGRGDREFEDVFKQATHEESGYRDRGRKAVKHQHINPPTVDVTPASPRFSRNRESLRSPMVRAKVNAFEEVAVGKRRASCLPAVPEKMSDDPTNRYSTWNTGNAKKRNRKQHRRRRRAYANDAECSEDESKRVNISLDVLNDIIKKNVSSAMKTIAVKGNSKGPRPLTPSDSFSTEETMFSGSSSHSTELPPGALNKHIKAQLDKDFLRGHRRMSAAPVMLSELNSGIRATNTAMYNPNQFQTVNANHDIHQNAYGIAQQQEIPMSPYLNILHAPQPIPPPPPPPPIPQVTFAHPNAHYSGMTPNQLQPLNNYKQELSSLCGIPPAALGRLQARRHTLASLDHGNLLSGFNDNLESKLEQVSKAIHLLDTNIKQGGSLRSTSSRRRSQYAHATDSNTRIADPVAESTTSASNKETTPGELIPPAVFSPVLSIADQIKALSTKPKKELKPGQIDMAGWVRGLLIFTNIVFLISGCGMMGLGIWMMLDPNIETYFAVLNVDKTSSDFKLICYALIGVGTMVTFISFMGCCGGLKSSKCLLTMFLVLVGVIAVGQAGLGVMVIVNTDSPSAIPILSALLAEVEKNLMSQLKRSLVEKYATKTLIGTTWDNLQKNMECCGASGADDYKFSAWKNDTTNDLTIPNTCCKLLSKTAEVPEPSNKLLCQMGTTGFFHGTGCFDMMVGWFKDNSKYILAGGITSLCIEVFSFIFALIILMRSHKKKKKQKKKNQSGLKEIP